DMLGRRRSELPQTAPTQNVYFDYDPAAGENADCASAAEQFGAGRLWRLRDESGSTRYCYDRFGNLVRKVQAVTGSATRTVGTTYNAAGKLLAMTYPSGAIVTWTRGSNGQVTGVSAKPTATAAQVSLVKAVSYLPFGPVASITYGNDRVQTRTFDLNYGIASITETGGAGGYTGQYGLDAVGNVTSLTERGTLTRTYGYDGQDRLKAVVGGSAAETYAYDATGNRLSKSISGVTNTYTYAATSHRLSSISGVSARTYDANGNTLSHASLVWTYDDRNRPRDLRQSGTLVRTWYYNGRGERVRRVFNATPASNTGVVYDEAGHLLGEYSDSGTRIAEYVWMDDLLVGVLKNHDGTTYQYVETDHLGTPRAIINPATNTAIWRWDLTATAFGEHLADADPDLNALAYGFNLRYPGQYWDGIARIYYNYFRDYDAQTGRYLESDPIGLGGGVSTYAYVTSGPLTQADPLGLAANLHYPKGVNGVLSPGARYNMARAYQRNVVGDIGHLSYGSPDSAARAFRGAFARAGGYFGVEFGAGIIKDGDKYYLGDFSMSGSDQLNPKTMNFDALGSTPFFLNEDSNAWCHTHPEWDYPNKRFSANDAISIFGANQDAYLFYPEGYGRKVSHKSLRASSPTVDEFLNNQNIYAPEFK
ncbi:MAG TPA: RHS repeat-associated core domain-containing protein, partial [Vicinamibacterales bacterium]|nr:RHS repeat-associated core domain-containing protein [Vicinamibacterales bacterium]